MVKIEDRGEVPANLTSPGADIGLANPGPGLQEANDGGEVKNLRTDIAAAAPGLDDNRRDADTQANRRSADEFIRRTLRRHRGGYMVEKAIVLVVGQNEYSGLEHGRIRRESV